MRPIHAVPIAVAVLFSVHIAGPISAAESAGASGRKENLDLPLEAAGRVIEDSEEDPRDFVVLYGQEFEGDGIFLCCDRSGSMKEGDQWKRLQQEVIKNISQFSERVQFGIVFFDANLTRFPASGKPAEASPSMKGAATAMVLSTQPGSGSCVQPALMAALGFSEQSSSRRKVIVLITDGLTTCPGRDFSEDAREVLDEVTRQNGSRAQIHGILIGSGMGGACPMAPGIGVDEAFLRELVSRNGGSFARIAVVQ